MAKRPTYEHVGSTHTFRQKAEPDNPWPFIIGVMVLLLILGSCSG
jgi:hypothetical protein